MAVWWLYQRIETQWRSGFNGRTGLDYGPAIAIIKDLRWPLTATLGLLSAIENAALEVWDEQRQSGQG